MSSTTPASRHGRPSKASRRLFLWLGVLALIALGFRLWVCYELRHQPSVLCPNPSPYQGTDMSTYKYLAQEILQGNIPEYFDYQPFYYTFFLPLVFAVGGFGPWGVMISQALLGAATVWFTGLIGARLFGHRAALVAAGLVALSRYHIFCTPFMLFEVLYGFWCVLVTWLSLRAYDKNSLWHWMQTALALAAAILTRGNAILLLPGILLLMGWRNRGAAWKRLLAWIPLFLVLMYLPQLPFALHNYGHFGRWTGPSTAGEKVLALGNNPEAPPGGLDYTLAWKEWMRQAELPLYERTPIRDHVLNWIREEPWAWLELKFRMLLLYWNETEVPNNISYRDAADSFALRLPVLLDFSVVGTLGLTGFLLSWRQLRHSPRRGFVAFVLAAGCAGTVLFYVLARFRLPLVPIIAIFGGAALARFINILEDWRRQIDVRRRAILFLLALASSYLIVLHGYPFYATRLEKSVIRIVRPHGVVFKTDPIIVCHDNGPSFFGAWEPLEVPRSGLRMIKTIRLPKSENIDSAYVVARLPVIAPQGGQLKITGIVQGRPQCEVTMDCRAGNAVEHAIIELGEIRGYHERLRVELFLQPDPGPVLTVIDTRRCYGRTLVVSPQGVTRLLTGEACVELLLVPATPAAEEEDDDAASSPSAAPAQGATPG